MVLADYVRASAVILPQMFKQKRHIRGIPVIDQIGGPIKGLTFIVTGPTSGIGKETAAALLRRKAHVILACRNIARGESVKRALETDAKQHGNSNPCAEVMLLDISSLQSIRDFAQQWAGLQKPLHCLINNAGVFFILGNRQTSIDGYEMHMATNHLGPFLLTMLLLPCLQDSNSKERPGRVVNVASRMSEVGKVHVTDPHLAKPGAFSSVRAYGQSKLCQIMWTAMLRQRFANDGRVVFYALNPGEVMTDVVRSLPSYIGRLYRLLLKQILLTPMEGARASILCATSQQLGHQDDPRQCYYDYKCKMTDAPAAAFEPATSRWLWRWSAETTALPSDLNLPESGNN